VLQILNWGTNEEVDQATAESQPHPQCNCTSLEFFDEQGLREAGAER
jgi:hypothetical protein